MVWEKIAEVEAVSGGLMHMTRASLPAVLCISNEDMDHKNIIWDNGSPWMIDLECLDYGNPISHVMQLALQWSGTVACEMNVDKMIAFLTVIWKHMTIVFGVTDLEHSYEGWKIVKELTSHSALKIFKV